MRSFVHLHVHTEYSLLDGASKIDDLLDKCREHEMSAMAITDHGVMYGVVDFYKEAIERGIKPILGCEVYIARRKMTDKEANVDSNYSHLVLLAKNNVGYQNLMALSSLGFIEGFYYKPRIDYDTLEKHSEGLIGLSACLAGDIPRLLLENRYDEAKKLAQRLNAIFGQDHFYLELQDHGLEDQRKVNESLVLLSRETSIPLVATNDIHYIKKEDAYAQDVLLCIQTGKTIDEQNRMRFETSEFYLKSPEEMESIFFDNQEALENTKKIADMCDVKLDLDNLHLPKYDVPAGYEPFEYLKELCYKGIMTKYPNLKDNAAEKNEVMERLAFELDTINEMGYVDYFLIVWDFIKYARDKNIIVGPGRGSAAGSLVAYSLDITQIDPLKYGLLFERFLNPERVSMPDIDIDFCYERRQEVIDYVIQKYGSDRVAQIVTFGTMAARAAIRDVGRALNLPYGDVDKVAKMIPFELGMTIEKALKINVELRMLYEEDSTVRSLIDTSMSLEGLPRHTSTHAAGVVISNEAVTKYVPLQKNDDCVTTQFPMGTLEELGLLKMDFLGLRTLTVIRDAVSMIEQSTGKSIDIRSIPLDDPNVYDIIAQGDTEGVFQLKSSGMKQFMKELKPGNFEDIIAGISLYRPGPMDQIPRYIENKHHPESIEYTDESLAPILSVTYGCMVYQEQVMQVVRELAGYSLGRSDLVRRAMSKKKSDVMQKERHHFIHGIVDEDGKVIVPGAMRNGVSEEKANQIFDEMMEFAKYAFNKSHAAAYALVAYQTAWLKYYYPIEFMAALITSVMDNSGKVAGYIHYCRKKGIGVLPPDVNEGYAHFAVSGNSIRFGLAAVKNVGRSVIESIIEAREKKGKFTSFSDFCNKVDGTGVNKRLVESLIKCGAFDSLGVYRSQLIMVYEKVLDGVAQDRKRNVAGQLSLFEIAPEETMAYTGDMLPDIEEFDKKLLLSMEKETVGVYISGHPLDEFKDMLDGYNNTQEINSLKQSDQEEGMVVSSDFSDGSPVTLAGIISHKKTMYTKKNHLMAFVQLEDLYDTIEVIVFPTVYSRYSALLDEDSTVIIKGRISLREDEDPKVICNEVEPLTRKSNAVKNLNKNTSKLYLKISKQLKDDIIETISSVLEKYPGDIPVILYSEATNEKMLAESSLWVRDDNFLIIELSQILGENCVKMVQ